MITDRVDLRKIMVAMNVFRTALTIAVGLVVLWQTGALPAAGDVTGAAGVSTNWLVYWTLLITALLFGMAEVL